MEGKRLIQSLRLKNFLSFGNESEAIELQPLNVLIGANASGKSNFIEAIRLLQSLSGDFASEIRRGGGVSEFISKNGNAGSVAEIEILFSSTDFFDKGIHLRYSLGFTRVGHSLVITNEAIDEVYFLASGNEDVTNFYSLQNNKATLISIDKKKETRQVGITNGYLRSDQSILSQIKDPINYPHLSFLERNFGQIKIFRGWRFLQHLPPRTPATLSMPNDFLWEDAQNLALVINRLDSDQEVDNKIIEEVKNLYPHIEKITTLLQDSTIQIYFQENTLNKSVSASRLSDGTLRFLCLLSILCHPTPPPLICIEEPEIGLHPDILPTVAKLLIEASKRTQLIITTHSDILVSALSEIPEAVLVCERDANGTHLHRLDSNKLKSWLDDYSLGELWIKGEIGGKRW